MGTRTTCHALGRLVACGLLLLTATPAFQPARAAQSRRARTLPELLHAAEEAHTVHDLAEEIALLERAQEQHGSPEDEAEVQRRLALLEWKFLESFDDAHARLERAAEGPLPTQAWLELVRLELARQEYGAARAAADRARESAEGTLEDGLALIAAARATIDAAVEARLVGEAARTAELEAIHAELASLVRVNPGYLDPSLLLLRSALLLDQGETALFAWRSYFHVAADGEPPGAIAGAAAQLTHALSHWRGAHATAGERAALVLALGGSRLFTEALLVARDPLALDEVRAHAGVRELALYEAYLFRLRELTQDYYRAAAIGKARQREYRRAWEQETATVVARLAGDEQPERFHPKMLAVLEQRFGAHVMRSSATSDHYDVFMGHAVIDETRTVEQYGQRAELRFVQLDAMVSNGFASWYWEHGASSGGWGGAEGMWQVRSGYANDPLSVWRQLNTPDELRALRAEIERESKADRERAASDPHAYLPGLAARLSHQGRTRLKERLEAEGLSGEALRMTFLGEYERAVQESSIFAHEGRHAIDARGLGETGTSEYTAKLSQIAFAPEPRLAFGGILFGNIGGDSPHGKANKKLVKGLVRWMDAHAGEIDGLKEDRPLLPQLDRLTDEQLRAAARWLDPMARP